MDLPFRISKKLSLAIAGILAVMSTAFAGDISWFNAITAITGIVMTYIAGQSAVDAQKAAHSVDNSK